MVADRNKTRRETGSKVGVVKALSVKQNRVAL